MKKDEIGDRMKSQYENRTKFFLPRRTYTIIRVDGKAFHSFTKDFERPFSDYLMDLMDRTALTMCEQIQGAQFAYVQSDEISVLLTDFNTIKTAAWFDGNVQKMSSISASIATTAFNSGRLDRTVESKYEIYRKPAMFDARVFTIPDPTEVSNYFVWRQQDATRNSIQMTAQSLYSHKELQGKNASELQEMIFQKGINWNNLAVGKRRGRFVEYVDIGHVKAWRATGPPVFTQVPDFLNSKIPRLGANDEVS